MSGNKRYALDANVFIEAKNKYYGFDVCPGFWRALVVEHSKGYIVSIDRVRDELVKMRNEPDGEPDPLSDWAKDTVPGTFFKKTQDQAVVNAFRDMAAWVNSESQFTPAAKAEFASAADGWLIAYAKVNALIVVTHEEYARDVKKKVPIPNVCLEFDVKYVNTFEMLEALKVKFILGTKRQRRK
ncbi:MAG: DUF4411 family protein [Candidatus Aminicenantales bacterium]